MEGKLIQEHNEPTMTETVVLAELYGPEPEGIFTLLDKYLKPATIKTSYGDLLIMVNVLMDYANILERTVEDWNLTGFHAASYRYHAERCRKISRHYAKAIGYDYESAVENCRKKRAKQNEDGDVGEEALAASYHKKVREAEAKARKKEAKEH